MPNRLQDAFLSIAFYSLKANNKEWDDDDIQAESARIERCVDHHYKIDRTSDLSYEDFATKFLLDNYKEIVFGDKYLGNYLDDVPDVEYDDGSSDFGE